MFICYRLTSSILRRFVAFQNELFHFRTNNFRESFLRWLICGKISCSCYTPTKNSSRQCSLYCFQVESDVSCLHILAWIRRFLLIVPAQHIGNKYICTIDFLFRFWLKKNRRRHVKHMFIRDMRTRWSLNAIIGI